MLYVYTDVRTHTPSAHTHKTQFFLSCTHASIRTYMHTHAPAPTHSLHAHVHINTCVYVIPKCAHCDLCT